MVDYVQEDELIQKSFPFNKIAVIGNSIVDNTGANLASGGTEWLASPSVSLGAVPFVHYMNFTKGISMTKWVCTVAGTTGAIEPDWPLNAVVGQTVKDGSVTWEAAATSGAFPTWKFGWWPLMQMISGQPFEEAVIMGRPGKKSDEILTYVDRILQVPDLGIVYFANIFENDFVDLVDIFSIIASWKNYVSVVEKCRNVGKHVMVQKVMFRK